MNPSGTSLGKCPTTPLKIRMTMEMMSVQDTLRCDSPYWRQFFLATFNLHHCGILGILSTSELCSWKEHSCPLILAWVAGSTDYKQTDVIICREEAQGSATAT